MKQMYFFVLTLITTAFVLGLALLKINDVAGGTIFSIPTEYQTYVNYAKEYGAMTLLCCFAFGGLAGKVVKVIVVILLILAILVFVIATFAPQWISNLFGGGKSIITLFSLLK